MPAIATRAGDGLWPIFEEVAELLGVQHGRRNPQLK